MWLANLCRALEYQMLSSILWTITSAQKSKLLGIWPLNIQYRTSEASGQSRDAVMHHELPLKINTHYFQWLKQNPDSYIFIPQDQSLSATDYVYFHANIIVDSFGYSSSTEQQIVYMDNGYCVLDVYYRYGKIYFARTVAGDTVTVSKTLGLDIVGKYVFSTTDCHYTDSSGNIQRSSKCIAIIDDDSGMF